MLRTIIGISCSTIISIKQGTICLRIVVLCRSPYRCTRVIRTLNIKIIQCRINIGGHITTIDILNFLATIDGIQTTPVRTIRNSLTGRIGAIIDINTRSSISGCTAHQIETGKRGRQCCCFKTNGRQGSQAGFHQPTATRLPMSLSCFLHSHPSVGMFIPYSTVNFVHLHKLPKVLKNHKNKHINSKNNPSVDLHQFHYTIHSYACRLT